LKFERSYGCRERQGIERRGRRQIDHLFAHPRSGAERTIGAADFVAIAQDGLTGFDGTERDFVRLRDFFANGQTGWIGGALGNAFRIDDDADVIGWVDADEEPGHTGILTWGERRSAAEAARGLKSTFLNVQVRGAATFEPPY
jgi:hypothetical protein